MSRWRIVLDINDYEDADDGNDVWDQLRDHLDRMDTPWHFDLGDAQEMVLRPSLEVEG